MRNTVATGVPIFGVFCAAQVVLLLVLAAERSGLPIPWSEWFVRVILFITLVSAVWFGRCAAERLFLGREPSAAWQGGGLILGVIIFVALRVLPSAHTAELWLPGIVGTLIGVVTAHLLLRMHFKRTRLSGLQVSGLQVTGLQVTDLQPLIAMGSSLKSQSLSVIIGIALCCLGCIIALPSLGQALTDIVPALGNSSRLALTYVLILSISAVALGGAKGCLAMVAMMTLIALGSILLSVTIGLTAFGSFPLPNFENPTTLQAINEVKTTLGLKEALFFQQWPAISSIFTLNSLTAMMLAALISAATALILAPAVQVRRRRVMTTACAAIVILPLLIMALGGYAIEVAAEQLLGSAINNPPAALIEATRLGLVQVCGGFPDSAEALRLQCGVSPRDTALIDSTKLQPQAGFLTSSLPVSLGYTSVISQVARVFPFALSIIGFIIGIWFMAVGLGRYILGQRHNAPGLASHRIALTRMSAVLAALVLGMLNQYKLAPPEAIAAIIGGVSAAVIILVQLNTLLSSIRAPRQTPQAA